MGFYYSIALFFGLIIYAIMLKKRREPIRWITIFCVSLLPFIVLIMSAIYAFFDGSGLVGDDGGLSSALFVIVIFCVYMCYVYIPSLILLILSAVKVFGKKKESN